ncbi:hypothetical protein GCM10029978_091380 [Actinoallomurus acanthiterrae]
MGERRHGVPPSEEIRRAVTRGRSAVFPLDATVDMPGATALAAGLRAELARDDLLVLVWPGRPPSIRVVRLVGEPELTRCRAELETLVADFRRTARRLIERCRAEAGPAWDEDEAFERIEVDGAHWWLSPHGEHCRFERADGAEVVEAHIERPAAVDPGFLLLFAETSGGYPNVRAACVEGFHDMCRMLESAGVTAHTG